MSSRTNLTAKKFAAVLQQQAVQPAPQSLTAAVTSFMNASLRARLEWNYSISNTAAPFRLSLEAYVRGMYFVQLRVPHLFRAQGSIEIIDGEEAEIVSNDYGQTISELTHLNCIEIPDEVFIRACIQFCYLTPTLMHHSLGELQAYSQAIVEHEYAGTMRGMNYFPEICPGYVLTNSEQVYAAIKNGRVCFPEMSSESAAKLLAQYRLLKQS